MTIWDDRILEYLLENDWGSPDTIHWELGDETTLHQVRERCRILCHAGLAAPFVDDVGADMFEITVWGQLYLEGKVNAGLIRPLPKPRPPDKVRPKYWAANI